LFSFGLIKCQIIDINGVVNGGTDDSAIGGRVDGSAVGGGLCGGAGSAVCISVVAIIVTRVFFCHIYIT
jgi:hypothetical protein